LRTFFIFRHRSTGLFWGLILDLQSHGAQLDLDELLFRGRQKRLKAIQE